MWQLKLIKNSNFAAENASDLRNKHVILATNTRALDLSVWMLTEDQIILYSIKTPSKL